MRLGIEERHVTHAKIHRPVEDRAPRAGNAGERGFARTHAPVRSSGRRGSGVLSHATYASVLDVPGLIDVATVYVPPEIGVMVMEELAKKQIPEVWLNPGADGPRVVARARELGLKTILACSIIAIGESPY